MQVFMCSPAYSHKLSAMPPFSYRRFAVSHSQALTNQWLRYYRTVSVRDLGKCVLSELGMYHCTHVYAEYVQFLGYLYKPGKGFHAARGGSYCVM